MTTQKLTRKSSERLARLDWLSLALFLSPLALAVIL